MTHDGKFSYDNVKRWTKQFKTLRDYDLMIIPINIPGRNHWVLAVINFNTKNTVIYDSFEMNTLRPAHPEIHQHLLSWLTREHRDRGTPFNAQDWTVIRGQQTTQQGTRGRPDVDCGVFVLAFAMYLSTNRPFEFCQNDMPTLEVSHGHVGNFE